MSVIVCLIQERLNDIECKCVGWCTCDHVSGDVFATHGLGQCWRTFKILCRSSVALLGERHYVFPASLSFSPFNLNIASQSFLLFFSWPGLSAHLSLAADAKPTDVQHWNNTEKERYKEAVARAVWWALDVTAWWLNNECGVSGFTWSQGHGPWLERRRGQERQNREGKGEKEELDESHGRRGERKDAKQPKSVFLLYFCLEKVSKWCLLIVELNVEFNHIHFFIWRCIACQMLVLW